MFTSQLIKLDTFAQDASRKDVKSSLLVQERRVEARLKADPGTDCCRADQGLYCCMSVHIKIGLPRSLQGFPPSQSLDSLS